MVRALPEVPTERPFAAAADHLDAALAWLRRLLAWQVAVTRQTYGALADDAYRGLYVADKEVDLVADPPADALPNAPELAEWRAALAGERAALDTQALATEWNGLDLPLRRLARLFGLSAIEQDVLLLGLAPEIDLRLERLYAYAQDDVTRKRPSVDLALRLFCPDPAARQEARTIFAPEAPLLRHRLIRLLDDGRAASPLLARFVAVDDRIVAELLGQGAGTVDAALAPFVALTRPRRDLDDLVLPPALIAQLRRTAAELSPGPGWQASNGSSAPPAPGTGGLALALQGGYGSGRRTVADALCAARGLPLLTVAVDRLVVGDLDPGETVRRLLREATLHGAAIFWRGIDGLLRDGETAPAGGSAAGAGAWRAAIFAALGEHGGCSFLPLDAAWEARGALDPGVGYLRLELPTASYADRARLWRTRLDGTGPDDATLGALASTFRLSAGQIRDAVAMARSLARWRGDPLTGEDLFVACRAQSSGRLDSLAHKIRTTYGWDDIVLPPDQVGQLREIAAQVRHRGTVLETWGFDAHLAMGKGLNALFAGPSGTGKTMAAEIVAADLGLELFKVDLSTLVSKYIGETEKNLDRIFTAAREANAILFFDEADAIFGKRSEVKDAHDRYANIEVGYLLQKMEEYDGIVILATNLRKNLDDAFLRRLHAAIEFPFPQEPDRRLIWQRVFPPAAPLAPDVDLAFLAERFKLTGGNIRNVALLAAFLAAEAGGAIAMPHLMRATKREYQKLGKLLTEAEFGPYFALVRG